MIYSDVDRLSCQGISKVAKLAKKRQNGQKYKISSNWLPVGVVFDINGFACYDFFLFPSSVNYHDVDRLSRDIKSSHNDQKKAKHYQIHQHWLVHLALMACLLRFLIYIFSEFTLMWTSCQGIPKVSLRLQSGPKGGHNVLLLQLFCFFVSPQNLSWPQCSGIIK